MEISEARKKPVLNADGKPWVQTCLYCDKQINFIKDIKHTWLRVGDYVRHKKCTPPPAK